VKPFLFNQNALNKRKNITNNLERKFKAAKCARREKTEIC